MPQHEALTPEDDLFCRVAIYNKFVTREQVEEATRLQAAEREGGNLPRPIATILILRKSITPKQAGAVEAAIRARNQTAAPTPPVAPTPKPRPMNKRARTGDSQLLVPTASGALADWRDARKVDDAVLRKIVERISPGRIYPEMLDYIVKKRITVVNLPQMATVLGESERTLKKAFHQWRRKGVLRAVGDYPYCFSPTEREKEEIKIFLQAWRDPERHSEVLGYILACE